MLPPGGELSIKQNISVNDARGWGGWNRREDGGKEKVGARGKKPSFMIPGIVSSNGVVVFAVGVAGDEI